MRRVLVSLLLVGLISGCLNTHNTDGTRPDAVQHVAHVGSASKLDRETHWDNRDGRHTSCADPEYSAMEREADLAWARRNLTWSEYQDAVMQRDGTSSIKTDTRATIAPVQTTCPEFSKPKAKSSKSISQEKNLREF